MCADTTHAAPATASTAPNRRRLSALCLPLLLAACAPDAWHADSAFDGFLERVRVGCVDTRIGSVTVRELMPDTTTTDVFFMDVTSRFYHGRTSRADYLAALEGQYMASPDSPGIACLFAQLPVGTPPAAR